MGRKIGVVMVVMILALVMVIPAGAITYGEPDLGEHPFVGLIAFYNAEGEFIWRCSGSMLAPQIMVTAGHCTAADADGTPVRARVYFDETIYYDPIADDYTNDYYLGIPVPHPGYNWETLPETYDIGVILLDEPVVGLTEFAQLPPMGLMDTVGSKKDKRWVIVTPVGYGVNDMYPDQISLRTRYRAQSFLINLNNTLTDGWNIASSNNPGQWAGSEAYTTGGTCFGDSGGPVFLGGSESNLIVGITSFGTSAACSGVDYSWRVDTEASRAFLAQFADEYGFIIP